MEKPIWFLDKIHQTLSNAPSLKCFGPVLAHIRQCEYQQISLNFTKIQQKFDIFWKNENLKKFQNDRFRRVFIENVSEMLRLKAHDPYFPILQCTRTYEHPARICEHIRTALFGAIFVQILLSKRFIAVYRRFTAVYGKTDVVFRKTSSRAFKRTNSEVFCTQIRQYSSSWISTNFAEFG